MTDTFDLGAYATEALNPLWFVAMTGMFVTNVCESARPRAVAGEKPISNGVLGIIGGVASVALPFLLFVYAFWALVGFEGAKFTVEELPALILARQVVIAGLVAFMLALNLGAMLPAWLIGRISPPLGRSLYRLAPYLALTTLALAIYFAWSSVLSALELFITRTPH